MIKFINNKRISGYESIDVVMSLGLSLGCYSFELNDIQQDIIKQYNGGFFKYEYIIKFIMDYMCKSHEVQYVYNRGMYELYRVRRIDADPSLRLCLYNCEYKLINNILSFNLIEKW